MYNPETVAPCGLYCGVCGIYMATAGGDATLTLSCAGQPSKQATLGAGQLATVSTGWTGTCSAVTVGIASACVVGVVCLR